MNLNALHAKYFNKSMKNNNSSELISLHPLLRLPSTRIFWIGKIKKLTSKGSYRKRFLAIATPGIYILEQKTFPRSFILNSSMAFSDIRVILLSQNNVIISGNDPKAEINFMSNDYVKLTAMIYGIIKAMFSDLETSKKFRFQCSSDLKKEFSENSYEYQTESILADRFTNYLLYQQITKNTSLDLLIEIIELLKNTHEKFTFNGDIAASSFIWSIVQSIAFDNNIYCIKFEKLNFCSFFPHFIPIIENNGIITRLNFDGVTFVGSADPFKKIPEQKLFEVQEIHFNSCELTTNSFLEFIKFLTKIGCELYEISFYKCTFTKEIINSFFDLIETSCSSLTSLRFEHIRLDSLQSRLLDFLTSNLLTNGQQLKKLTLISCNLDIATVLSKIVSVETGLTKINFSKNTFTKPLKTPITNFYNIHTIILSTCSFTPESFAIFFNSLSRAENSPTHLVFDALRFDLRYSNQIYNTLTNTTLPNVTKFSWNKNPMKATSTQKFVRFLLNQPSIIKLELSNSMLIEDIDESMKFFLAYIKGCQLNTLIMKGEHPNVYGEHLYPILNELSQKTSLKSIDLSGQEIQEKGIEYIYKIIENGLEGLRFDGSGIKSFNSFVKFCNTLISSDLIFANWPEHDEKIVSQKLSPNQKNELQNLKKKFLEHFSNENLVPSFYKGGNSSSEIKSQPSSSVKNSQLIGRKFSFSSSTLQQPLKHSCISSLGYKEDFMFKLCSECVGHNLTVEDDVLLKKYHQIQELCN